MRDVALASELGGEDVRGALERYEAARRPRAELALKLSRRADRIAQLATPIACALRNALAARTPASVQRRRLLPLIAGDQPN